MFSNCNIRAAISAQDFVKIEHIHSFKNVTLHLIVINVSLGISSATIFSKKTLLFMPETLGSAVKCGMKRRKTKIIIYSEGPFQRILRIYIKRKMWRNS